MLTAAGDSTEGIQIVISILFAASIGIVPSALSPRDIPDIHGKKRHIHAGFELDEYGFVSAQRNPASAI
jgi:hypothetical protein